MLNRIANGQRVTYHKRVTTLLKLLQRGYLMPPVAGQPMELSWRGLAWIHSAANQANGS
jgi:hypothetical protein